MLDSPNLPNYHNSLIHKYANDFPKTSTGTITTDYSVS